MEEWRDIPGHEGAYQASSEGRIRSVDRFIECSGKKCRFKRLSRGRILRPGCYDKSGHLSVVLGHGENGSPVHRLVALTFLGTVPLGQEVLHNNGDPTDNRVQNLRYGTRTENILDVYRQGNRWRRLSAEDAVRIRERLDAGERGADLAREYQVSESAISKIKLRRAFQWA